MVSRFESHEMVERFLPGWPESCARFGDKSPKSRVDTSISLWVLNLINILDAETPK